MMQYDVLDLNKARVQYCTDDVLCMIINEKIRHESKRDTTRGVLTINADAAAQTKRSG